MGERLRPAIGLISTRLTKGGEGLTRNVLLDPLLERLVSEVVVNGRENIPKDIGQQGYIVAPNHLGWAEAPVLLRTFPVWIYWMSKEENFARFPLNFLLSSYGFFPVKRGEVDRNALETADRLLSEGKVVGMIPEGTRGRQEGKGLKPAKRGTIWLAVETETAIIPTAVWGTEKLFPLLDKEGLRIKDLINFKPPVIYVNIGPVFDQHLRVSGAEKRRIQEDLTTNLMLRIRDLLPPEYHGYYERVREQELTVREFAK